MAGTEVVTGQNANGTFSEEPIEDVQVDETVLTRNQYDPNAPLEQQRVTAVIQHTAYALEDVTILDASGKSETIQATLEHPFYVEGLGWTGSSHLIAGEHLLEPDGSEATVTSVTTESHPEGVTVYNFTVDTDHTYFVDQGGAAVWVHNNCSPEVAIERSIEDPDWARNRLRAAMEKANGSEALVGNEAHHGIPLELLKDSDVGEVIMQAAKAGFDINSEENGIIVPEGHGPHPEYTADIKNDILTLSARYGNSPEEARGLLDAVVRAARMNTSYYFGD